MTKAFSKMNREIQEATATGKKPLRWHVSKKVEGFFVKDEKHDATDAELLGLNITYNGDLAVNEMLLETDAGNFPKFTIPMLVDLDAYEAR